jgi:hypothetical protein
LSDKIKVENQEDLVRDVYNGAILNTNLSSIVAYKARKNEINKMRTLENRVCGIETDLRDIKSLLQQLVVAEGKNNQ